MKKKATNETKIVRVPTWLKITATLLLPPAGAILIGVDAAREKKEKEQESEASRQLDELIEKSKVNKEETPPEENEE